MRLTLMGVALVLSMGPARAAPDDKPDKKDLSPAQEVERLVADYAKAQQDFQERYGKAKTDAERTKLVNEGMTKPGPVAARLLELAEKNPTDKEVNPKALVWVVDNAGYDAEGRKAKEKAFDQLTRDHAASDVVGATNEQVGYVCLRLTNVPSAGAEKFMRAVAEKNPKYESMGRATLALGQYLKNKAETVRGLKQDAEVAKRVEAMTGKETAERLAAADPEKLEKEAEKQFKAAAEKFADLPLYGSTVGEFAKGDLFELQNLGIGKVAPEIQGEDLDGQSFKLSDYRGKVVVLDFWGNW